MTIAKLLLESELPGKEELAKLVRSGIILDVDKQNSAERKIGESRIGGIPDLPEGITWPYSGELPLAFVAQINLNEIPMFQDRMLLPQQGMLYFFYEPTQNFNSEVLRPGHSFFTVKFFEQPGTLTPKLLPDELEKRWRFPSWKITFQIKDTYPSPSAGFSDPVFEALSLLEDPFAVWDIIREDLPFGPQILGHPDPVQGSLEKSCEYERVGEMYPEKKFPELGEIAKVGYQDWLLLLQVHSDFKLGIDWQYDMASIYFMIRRQDLLKRDFSQTWFAYQDH